MDVIDQRSQQERALVAEVDKWLQRQSGEAREKAAIISLELDEVRRLRAIHGIEQTNQILKEIHTQLAESMREVDRVTSLSDSELAITLFGIKNSGHAVLAIRKLQNLLRTRLTSEDNTVYLKPFFGVAIWPDVADHGEELLRLSRLAMNAARDNNKEVVTYDLDSKSKLFHDWSIEPEIQRAISNDEFVLYYQPQLNIGSSTITGAEALLRWAHPEHGFLTPADFILLTEQSDAIHALTRWCLHTAMRQLKSWLDTHPELSVSVNISGRNFYDPSFYEVITNSIELWGIAGNHLTLEITESILLDDMEYATGVLNALRERGIRISLDDFGTGYSSLSYLKNLPVDELKIDQSFIRNMIDDKHDRFIVETIIKIADDFGFDVVAEGIESTQHMALLKTLACKSGQGYDIAHPMPEQEFLHWLEDFKKP